MTRELIYHSREWLNPKTSPFSGHIIARVMADTDQGYIQQIQLQIADCTRSIQLHNEWPETKAESALSVHMAVEKLTLLQKEISALIAFVKNYQNEIDSAEQKGTAET